MANTREIKQRIKGVEGTKKITKTMKLIAASKVKMAREMHTKTLPFFKRIQEIMNEILLNSGSDIRELYFDNRENKKDKKKAYIVISSDNGLIGSYNSNVIKKAVSKIEKENSIVLPVGKVIKNYMVKHGYNVDENFDTSSYAVTTIVASEIAKYVVKLFKHGDIDELHLIYTEMHNALSFETKSIKLLPLDTNDFDALNKEKADLLEFEPSAGVVLERVTKQYVKGILYGGMVEAFVSEHFARMNAMDAATTNADNVSKKLTIDYNRARQQAITQEISEIIGGAMNVE